jgi:hypothetical protein
MGPAQHGVHTERDRELGLSAPAGRAPTAVCRARAAPPWCRRRSRLHELALAVEEHRVDGHDLGVQIEDAREANRQLLDKRGSAWRDLASGAPGALPASHRWVGTSRSSRTLRPALPVGTLGSAIVIGAGPGRRHHCRRDQGRLASQGRSGARHPRRSSSTRCRARRSDGLGCPLQPCWPMAVLAAPSMPFSASTTRGKPVLIS